jgi:hypothetical protein
MRVHRARYRRDRDRRANPEHPPGRRLPDLAGQPLTFVALVDDPFVAEAAQQAENN